MGAARRPCLRTEGGAGAGGKRTLEGAGGAPEGQGPCARALVHAFVGGTQSSLSRLPLVLVMLETSADSHPSPEAPAMCQAQG